MKTQRSAVSTKQYAARNRVAERSAPSKQESILKSATYLFLKHGYSSTTMDSIASHANVTKQTVYAYYADKDTLFVHMISGLCQKHTPSKALLEDQNSSFEELLNTVGVALLNLITSPEVLAATRLVISESDRHPKLAQLYYDSGTQRLVSVLSHFLDQQNERGVIHVPNTASAASYFLAMLKGQYYLRMILRLKPAPNEKAKLAHVSEIVRIFMRLYGSDAPMVTHSTL